MNDRPRPIARSAILFCLLLACHELATQVSAQNFALNRRYDQYAYLTSHNSFANDVEDYNPLLANQFRSTLQQLDGGVRALMLDTYLGRQRSESGVRFAELYFNRGSPCSPDFCGEDLEVILAHSPALSQYSLLDGFPLPGQYPRFRQLRRDLGVVRQWMDDHPREIVSVILESYFVDPPLMMAEFAAVGLVDRIFWADRPNPGFIAPDGTAWEVEKHGWPRVGWMADMNRRLVIFSNLGEEGDGLANQFDFMASNVYGDESIHPATAAERAPGSLGLAHKSVSLLLANYFPTANVQGDVPFDELNAAGTITACLTAIADVTSRPPNFLAVDHFHRGILIPGGPLAGSGPAQVVRLLNESSWPAVPFIVGTHAITPPPNAPGWHRSAVVAALDGMTDDGDIAWVEYDIRGRVTESSNANGAVSLSLSEDGDYLVNYQVVGSLENRSDAQFFRVRIDLKAPTTQARLTPVEAIAGPVSGPVEVELTAEDGRSGVDSTWFRIAGGSPTRYSGAFDLTGEGPVQLLYWSIDVAGNEEGARRLTVILDPSLPTRTATHTSTRGATPTATPTGATPTTTPTGARDAPRTPRPLGDDCASADECGSSFCIDGVCCETSCGELLDLCNQPGVEGQCIRRPAATTPALRLPAVLAALLVLIGIAARKLRSRSLRVGS